MQTFNDKRVQSCFVILSELYAFWLGNSFSQREHEAMEKFYCGLFDTYKRYRNYGAYTLELECNKSPVQKCLFNLLQKDKKLLFDAKQIKTMVESEYVIIYGAGITAVDAIFELNNLGIGIHSIAVSNKKNNPEELFGIKVREITEMLSLKEKARVIVAVKPQFMMEIKENLVQLGFKNIIVTK